MRRALLIAIVLGGGCQRDEKATKDRAPAPAPADDRVTPEPSPSPPPGLSPTGSKPLDPAVKAAVTELAELMVRLGSAASSAGKDCDKAAAAFEAILGDGEPLPKMKALKADPTKLEELQQYLASNIYDLVDLMLPITSIQDACASHAGLLAVMKRLEL